MKQALDTEAAPVYLWDVHVCYLTLQSWCLSDVAGVLD